MKQVANMVADQQEKLGHLKLRVIYKNSQKVLADVINANEDLTFYFYHQSTSYKYHGRFDAENILSSVRYFMSLNLEEVPFKPLHTQEELESFVKSTDKSVLLIELCGWSNKLLHDKILQNSITPSHQRYSNDMLRERLSGEEDGILPIDKKNTQKDLKIEELTFGVENGLSESYWPGEFGLSNSNFSEKIGSENANMNFACIEKEFKQFKSYFSEFTVLAREFFLPSERIRFGLISERSLLPYIGVNNVGAWLLMLHFSGCPSCSVILQAGDDLRKILHEHHSPAMQLDVNAHNLESGFPAKRPSIVLFTDRSSDSSKIRGQSESALENFRKLAQKYQLSFWMNGGVRNGYAQPSSVQAVSESQDRIISGSLSISSMKDSSSPKIVKIKDDMTIVMVNKGQTILSDRIASFAQGNAAYDVFLDLLNKKRIERSKQTKISLVAKEIGFQLLSDDFEVQVVDSSQHHKEFNQMSDMKTRKASSSIDESFHFHKESSKESVNTNEILIASTEISAVDDVKHVERGDAKRDLKYLEMPIKYKSDNSEPVTVVSHEIYDDSGANNFVDAPLNEEDKSCKQNEMEQFLGDENSSLEHETIASGTFIDEDTLDVIGFHSSSKSASESQILNPSENFAENNRFKDEKYMKTSKPGELQDQNQLFEGSFFFVDGGYRLLKSLTGGSNIPSLVILDPVGQHHFVINEGIDMNFSNMLNFIEQFLNGNLSPYQPSASSIASSREAPRPPFVNLDFHEVDSIPQVTANTFCELVFGFRTCVTGSGFQPSNLGAAWRKDVLVLFGSSWCGFCQRLELIVREVYRAVKSLKNMLKCETGISGPVGLEDNNEAVESSIPSILMMDCAQNDCSSFLKAAGKDELYPEMLLYPAQNKTAVPYVGEFLVVNIIKFLASQGRNSHYLNKYKGFLWKCSWKNSKRKRLPHDTYFATKADHHMDNSIPQSIAARGNQLPSRSSGPNSFQNTRKDIAPGSILSATDKLLHATPFDNSTILIVIIDQGQGFQGIIINKPINWNIFENMDKDLEPLKQAPIFYGGPVSAQGLPLVSLSRKPTDGYTKIIPGVYFGDPVVTSMVIQGIKSGDLSAHDYWFFLGYSSWEWKQLFDELAEGSWNLSAQPTGSLDWPA